MMTPLNRTIVLLAALAAQVAMSGCTVNPATGKSDFTPFMTPAKERSVGASEHPKILAQFGGIYDDPNVGVYLAEIGGRLAAQSEMAGKPFRFTILNSPIPNAFALPGGYVYVTRGLLTVLDAEAELAGVVGHEIGHVTARHSAKRYSSAQGLGLLSAVLGAATGSSVAQRAAELGGGIYLSGYSRGQETQSDELGVRYMSRAGYDPYAHADALDAIGIYADAEARISGASNQGFDFFSTHPKTPKRVERAQQQASATGIAKGARPRHAGRYLGVVDGMVYGDDPAVGQVKGRTYVRTDPGFTFDVPQGFSLYGGTQTVVAKGSGNILIAFEGQDVSPRTSTQDYLTRVWAKSATLSDLQRRDIAGMEAVTGFTRVSDQKGSADLYLAVIRFGRDRVYRFQLQAPGANSSASSAFEQTIRSFRKLSAQEIRATRPMRLRVVTVKSGDSVARVAKRMAVPKNKVERFLAINSLRPGAKLRPGARVKIVVRD